MVNRLEEASQARGTLERRLREEVEAARVETAWRAPVHAEEASQAGELLVMQLRQEMDAANAAL
eukprot:13917853-Alexandrium_andersonii.AAC.1